MNLDRLLRPRRIAVYGGKWSDYVVEQCMKLGFDGEVWRVHPHREGCFRSTSDLPDAPDSAFLGISNTLTVTEIGHLAARGAGGAVVFASGFGERAGGADLASKLDAAAGAMPYLGPNCYGFANFFDRAALLPDQVTGGPVERAVAIITQSGTISLTLMYQRRSLPIGYLVTIGNQQRLTCADLVRYVADDPRVSAIGMYVEGIGDANRFAEAVDHARMQGKPVALVKAGRSERARAAALSHTGALTGSDALHDALFARLGIARCESLDELVETLKLLHCHGPLPSNRLVVAGASGGDMAMVADAAREMDIDFAPFDDAVVEALATCTGAGVHIDNPLDFHTYTWFDAAAMQRMFETLLDSGAALTAFMLDPPDESAADPAAFDAGIDAMLAACRASDGAGAVLSSLPESLSRHTRGKCLDAGAAPMQGLLPFLRAFEHAARIGATWGNWHGPRLLCAGDLDATTARRVLSEHDGKAMLARAGIAVPRGVLCTAGEAAAAARGLRAPLVVKAARAGLLHKSDAGGVALDIADADEAAAAARRLAETGGHVLIEEMVEDGLVELIVGAGRDPQFGLFLTVGAGGVLAELLRDTATLLPPVTRDDLRSAIRGLKIAPQLDAFRGRPAADVEAAVEACLAVWRLVEQLGGSLIELDVNPLIVCPAGRGAVAVDTLITLTEA